MPKRIAEEKIGNIVMYKYPDFDLIDCTPREWISKWLSRKFVLLGWDSVKEGIVNSFKLGRVKHSISNVSLSHSGTIDRPSVEISCGLDMHPVFNWACSMSVKRLPVVVLGIDQESYFRVCKKCLAKSEYGVGNV